MLRFILGLLIWLILAILLSVPLLILTIYKLIVIAIVKCRCRGGNEVWHVLPPSDSQFAPNSSWKKSVVNFGAVLKLQEKREGGYFSVEELRHHFHETFLRDDIKGGRYEKLSSYLERSGGIVFRVHTKEIDLKDHIYEVDYDEEKSEKSIKDFLVDWLLSNYKEKKPCWEMILVKATQNSADKPKHFEMHLAFKIHHSFADGYTLVHILDKLMGNESPYFVKEFEHSAFGRFRKIIETPTRFLGLLKLPRGNPFPVKLSPQKRFEWMLAFTSFPLSELKQFRRKHGVHMSSVIITLLLGGQRMFLEKEKRSKVPDRAVIATTCGWPNHPSRDPEALNRDKMCNHWSTTFGLASFVEEDRIKLLKEVDASLQNFEKRGLHIAWRNVLFPFVWTIPSCVFDSKPPRPQSQSQEPLQQEEPGSGGGGFSFGASITPIIGGDNYSLLGCLVDSIHPFFVFHDLNPSVPCSWFCFSHSGKLELTFGAHPSVYKDQETLDRVVGYLQDEFKILMKC